MMMISCRIRIRSSRSKSLFTLQQACLTLYRYDFEYEDDDEQETGDVDVENKYYNAKQMKADNPTDAITEFLGLPALEQEKGDWSVSPRAQATTTNGAMKGLQRSKAGD